MCYPYGGILVKEVCKRVCEVYAKLHLNEAETAVDVAFLTVISKATQLVFSVWELKVDEFRVE